MNTQKRALVKKARQMYKKIYPCPRRKGFSECFTTDDNRIFFWFNTEDRSTHLLAAQTVERERKKKRGVKA